METIKKKQMGPSFWFMFHKCMGHGSRRGCCLGDGRRRVRGNGQATGSGLSKKDV